MLVKNYTSTATAYVYPYENVPLFTTVSNTVIPHSYFSNMIWAAYVYNSLSYDIDNIFLYPGESITVITNNLLDNTSFLAIAINLTD